MKSESQKKGTDIMKESIQIHLWKDNICMKKKKKKLKGTKELCRRQRERESLINESF
jgi:CRISPR/Cas system-associated protein Cas5 (RAMP superfamily)